MKMKKSLPIVASEAGSQSTNIKAGLLTIMGIVVFIWIFGVSSIINSYYSARAYTYPYCFTDASNDDHCFSDKATCEQAAQQAGADKNDCSKLPFKSKYTATINGNTFEFDNKAECEAAAQQNGVQCIRVK